MKIKLKQVTTKQWLIAAGVRAIKTVAQTALGMMTVGAAVSEVNWMQIVSVSAVAGVYSILNSIVSTLPEVTSQDLHTL